MRTRSQAAASKKKSNKKTIKTASKKLIVECDSDSDSWYNPETNLKESVIRTYSNKQPYNTCWTSERKKLSKNNQASSHVTSKPDSYAKHPKTKLSQGQMSSASTKWDNIKEESPTTPIQPTNTQSKMSCKSTLKRTQNKTRMVVESMTACTMMQDIPNNTNLTGDDMSLCSMVQDNNEKIKNSTVLADFHNIDQDFVPNEISAILGQSEIQTTLVNNYYKEQTPKSQLVHKRVQSVKRVKFDVSPKTPKNENNETIPKKLNLRKTPYRNRDDAQKRPKTSSPHPNENISTLHCEVSTLTDIDCSNRITSKSTSSVQPTQDTEKLLDFEPNPLQCSENVDDENPRDVTPETCNSLTKVQTSSVKRRLDLRCHSNEEIPTCILLHNYTIKKAKTKNAIWFGQNPNEVSIAELDLFPDDILL